MKSNSKTKFWDLKPYWCQPWSIIIFGILVIIFSWIPFENIIFSAVVGLIIIIWWVVFLIIAPNLYQGISDKK
tara:strand:+ start:114 stop:332 length:219 start_codon:yes stop_codon:yes gene_type:complete